MTVAPSDETRLAYRRNLILFLSAAALLGTAGSMFETTFSNYLRDAFHINAQARGGLEFPRELPGFLTALFAGALFFLPETRIAVVAAIAMGLGAIGLALTGSHWWFMIALITVQSTGMHLLMPIRASIAMDLAQSNQKGKRLGQMQGVGLAASIIGCGGVWLCARLMPGNYRVIFVIAGVIAACAGFAYAFMRMPNAHLDRPKFVWRRAYWLYYVLAFLFGARKQVFITFGPWVLIQVYGQSVGTIAKLSMTASVLGILVQPMLGRAIDRFGERSVLITDSVLVFFVCLGYGYAHLAGTPSMALWILYACYVGDQMLFGMNMARDTYLAKIAQKAEHISPTLSLGVSINHIASMSLPYLAGGIWLKYNYSSVFLVASGVAVVMFIFSSMIPRHMPARAATLPKT